jgi:hypothetical protein
MMQPLRRDNTPIHQLGVTLLPALITVALLTTTIVWIDIPQQLRQQQTDQAMAYTNSIVQLLSASLKHYDEHNQWPGDLENDLAAYLPVLPSNRMLAGITLRTTAGDNAEITINAQTHANAISRQLARQFGELNVDIVDAAGKSVGHGDRVKVQLYAYKNGSSYYLAIDEGTDNFGGNVYGAATKETGYVSLTTNSSYQNGQIQFDNIHSDDQIYATFDTWIGGGTGAHALYFYWGATQRPTGEEGNSGGYNFAIDAYNNRLQLRSTSSLIYDSEPVHRLDDSQWHTWKVEMKEDEVSVWRDNILQFTQSDSFEMDNSQTFIGWGARTEDLNNHHRIRNIKVWISTNNGRVYDDL